MKKTNLNNRKSSDKRAVVEENNKNDLGGKIINDDLTSDPEEENPEEEKQEAEKPDNSAELTKALKKLEDAKAAYEQAKEEYKKLTGKGGKKSSEPKGPGVISTIEELVKDAGKAGISKSEILDELVKRFPDRAKDAMEKTINVQLPGRMSKEKNLNIKKSDEGKFYIAA